MTNSKLYLILSNFNPYEQNRCRKYIQSPYFNKSQELTRLYDLLTDHINKNNARELSKEILWAKMVRNKPYNDTRFRKYVSDLLKLVEGYLSQSVFDEKKMQHVTNLMEAVAENKIMHLYKSSIRQAEKISEEESSKSAEPFYFQFRIQALIYEITGFEIKRSQKSNVDLIADNLDNFYFAEKLKYFCTLLSERQVQSSDDRDYPFIQEIIFYLQKIETNLAPSVAVYYRMCLALLESTSENHYFELKKLLNEYGGFFPLRESSKIYTFALNYCTKKINSGNQRFLQEFFELYEDLLDKEIILEKGELDPWHFKNIVTVALRLKRYDWTRKFIYNYSPKLPVSLRENSISYNLAQLHFYQKNYEQVIEFLRDVEFEDFSYNLNSKTMLIATYYELDEVEPLFSLLESFRTYLNRHKEIPQERRVYYLNLIRYSKRLLRILPSDKKGIEKLKGEVQQNKNAIASFNWLHEKIAELEGV